MDEKIDIKDNNDYVTNQSRKASFISKRPRTQSIISEVSQENYNPHKVLVEQIPENSDTTDQLQEIQKISWIKLIGGAIIISICCIDPGNLQGDVQVAQNMHYKSIWVLLFSHALCYFFQEMSIQVGVYSGKDLSQLIRLNYSPAMKYFIWVCSEIAIIAADIQELIGASIALNLLFGISLIPSAFIVVVIVLAVLFIQEFSQQILEMVFLFLVALLGLCFCIIFGMIDKNFGDIMFGFIPNLPKDLSFTAVIGSIMMPQNLFLQSSLVLTRNTKNIKQYATKIFKIETGIVLFLSFLINFFIVGVFANDKFKDKEITLQNGGDILNEVLPRFSYYLYSLGLRKFIY